VKKILCDHDHGCCCCCIIACYVRYVEILRPNQRCLDLETRLAKANPAFAATPRSFITQLLEQTIPTLRPALLSIYPETRFHSCTYLCRSLLQTSGTHATSTLSNLTMAQKFKDEGAELAESPAPLVPDRQESVHPGLRSSLVNVPVTPGIHLGEYASRPTTGDSISYFSHDPSKLRNNMAQSPSDAAAGAKTNHEILRRMSFPSPGLQRKDSMLDIDPRAANPTLGLSGGVISATFCIPHSLQYRKGQDWVRHAPRITSPF
jgi:hypothetical protein